MNKKQISSNDDNFGLAIFTSIMIMSASVFPSYISFAFQFIMIDSYLLLVLYEKWPYGNNAMQMQCREARPSNVDITVYYVIVDWPMIISFVQAL